MHKYEVSDAEWPAYLSAWYAMWVDLQSWHECTYGNTGKVMFMDIVMKTLVSRKKTLLSLAAQIAEVDAKMKAVADPAVFVVLDGVKKPLVQRYSRVEAEIKALETLADHRQVEMPGTSPAASSASSTSSSSGRLPGKR